MAQINRLAREKSPYLLQHAHDPVDWYPWGNEAFELARREDKPVFLSIGYSTCHWCHVMQKESFADEELARLLNAGFVAVKVDREERPDLDQRFMAVCQSLTGSGGWPLTVMMTPDKQAFFAGTYFSKSSRWGRPGLLDILPLVLETWRARRPDVVQRAEGIAAALERGRIKSKGRRGDKLTAATLDEAFRELSEDFDGAQGGFGSGPKFPVAHHIGFLLRYWQRTGNGEALGMAGKTLKAMRRGGIYDHLGFGFHRYATDSGWLVPHFEKMLYDQAQLAEVYAEAFAATGRRGFRRTAAETADYVLRELASPEGGFYTAEDADSEGEEGRFYLWTRDDLDRVLGHEDAEFAALAFGVGEEGSASGPGGRQDGRNVLHEGRIADGRPLGPADTRQTTESRIEAIRQKLLRARGERPRPFMDTKILADWNGLMIAALAAVFRITGEDRYLRSAEGAADFVLGRMLGPDGRLRHAYAGGEARIQAFLDDYAFLVKGLMALYGAGYDPRYLERALELTERAIDLFWDEGEGGFFFMADGDDGAPRRKEIYDGAVPSGNSVMFMNLIRLARLTGRADLEDRASRLAAAFDAEIAAGPRMYTAFLCALETALGPSREVVVAGSSEAAETQSLLAALRGICPWDAVSLFKPTDEPERARSIERLAPFTKDMDAGGGLAAASVCSGGACLRPVSTAAGLLEALRDRPAVTSRGPRIRP